MKSFSGRRMWAIFSKEFKHILRDPFTLLMALMLPLAIVLILGNSIEFNVRSINMVYHDADRTESSRKLIETFAASNYFRPRMIDNPDHGFTDIVDERARVMVVVPPGFQRDAQGGIGADVQVLLDGTDNASVMAVGGYLNTISMLAQAKITGISPDSGIGGVNFKTRYLFNPELNSKWFSVPGLAAVIIALVAIMLTTLTICREWERGSMEMLLSTPATSLEIILGKVLPYAILSFIGFVLVFVVARVIFGVPFVGSYVTLVLATVLFILGYLAIGLFISISTHKQEVAIQFACIIGLLPTIMLSGFVFPVEYMNRGYQFFSSLFPARFYMDITRDQFLKGSSIVDLGWPFAFLGMGAAILMVACLVRFKRTLE